MRAGADSPIGNGRTDYGRGGPAHWKNAQRAAVRDGNAVAWLAVVGRTRFAFARPQRLILRRQPLGRAAGRGEFVEHALERAKADGKMTLS